MKPTGSHFTAGTCAATLSIIALTSSASAAGNFTEGVDTGGHWMGVTGQGFIVGLDSTPDPGLIAGDAVKLDSFKTYRAGEPIAGLPEGAASPDADVFAAITGAWLDFNGDPDGSWTPTTADILAISTNSYNPSNYNVVGDPMVFDFGSGVDLIYGDEYAAVYVTIDPITDAVTPIQIGVLAPEWVFDELQGIWIPGDSYGADTDWAATALFPDWAGDGFLDGCQFACDTRFEASFSFGAALPGDLDGDGFVGLSDLDLILNNWNLAVPPGDPLADPTNDNFIGLDDLDVVLNNWNTGTPPPVAAAPEPATAMLLGLGGGVALARRRR